jgi:hypothetical protein
MILHLKYFAVKALFLKIQQTATARWKNRKRQHRNRTLTKFAGFFYLKNLLLKDTLDRMVNLHYLVEQPEIKTKIKTYYYKYGINIWVF